MGTKVRKWIPKFRNPKKPFRTPSRPIQNSKWLFWTPNSIQTAVWTGKRPLQNLNRPLRTPKRIGFRNGRFGKWLDNGCLEYLALRILSSFHAMRDQCKTSSRPVRDQHGKRIIFAAAATAAEPPTAAARGSRRGGGRNSFSKKSEKTKKKSKLKKHMLSDTIFARFFVDLASQNDSKINVFCILFRKRRFRENRAPA